MIARDADILERLQEAQRSGDRREEANTLFVLGKRAGQRGEHRAAGRHFAESAQIWRELGDHQGLVESVNSIGISAAWCGDYALAKASMELTIELARRLNDTGALVRAMANLGAFAADNYDLETARRWCAESISLARQSDDAARAARATYNLAWVAFLEGQYEEARRLATDSESALHGQSMAVVEALAAMLQGRLNLRRRHFVIARPQLEYALKTLEAMGDADDSGLAAFLLGAKRLSAADAGPGFRRRMRSVIGRLVRLPRAGGKRRGRAAKAEGDDARSVGGTGV